MPVPSLSDVERAGVSAFAGGPLAKRFHALTDCLYPVAATVDDGYQFIVSGTGAGWTSLPVDGVNAVGIARLALGTTATGRGAIACPDTACIRLGGGVAGFTARARLVTLSTTLSAYTVRLGFIDSVSAEPTDGAYFRYTHAVNGGRWQAVIRGGGSEIVLDTGIAAATGQWDTFEIWTSAVGTGFTFMIDGATVGTVNTNALTAAGRETSFGLAVIRSAGLTALNAIDVDYLETEVAFTTPR